MGLRLIHFNHAHSLQHFFLFFFFTIKINFAQDKQEKTFPMHWKGKKTTAGGKKEDTFFFLNNTTPFLGKKVLHTSTTTQFLLSNGPTKMIGALSLTRQRLVSTTAGRRKKNWLHDAQGGVVFETLIPAVSRGSFGIFLHITRR